MSIEIPNDSALWHVHGDGSRIPYDGWFRMTHRQWAEVKARIDAAFEQVSEAEIIEDNHQKWLRSPAAPPEQRLREDGTPYDQPRRRSKTPGYVYLIKDEQRGLFKIGQSIYPDTRLKQLRRMVKSALTLLHVVATEDMNLLEWQWHRRFAERRVEGEWFRLSAMDVAAFVAAGSAP